MQTNIQIYRHQLLWEPHIIGGGESKFQDTGVEFILLWCGDNEQPMRKLDVVVDELVKYDPRTEFIDIRQNIPQLRVVLKGDINALHYLPFIDASTKVNIFEGYISENKETKVAIFIGDISLQAPNSYMSQMVNFYKNDKNFYHNDVYEGAFEMIDKYRDNPWLRLVGFDLHKLNLSPYRPSYE